MKNFFIIIFYNIISNPKLMFILRLGFYLIMMPCLAGALIAFKMNIITLPVLLATIVVATIFAVLLYLIID